MSLVMSERLVFCMIFVTIFTLMSAKSFTDNSLERLYRNDINENQTDKHHGGPSNDYWNPAKEICYTGECIKTGKILQMLINQTVNPCNDFYEYVCGKYSRDMQIPEGVVSVSTFQSADAKVQKIIRKQLSETNHKYDSISVRYATDMYNGCIDSNTTESRGVQPLVDALVKIGGWPLVNNVIPFDEKSYNIFEAIAKFIAFYAESAILDISVSPDLKNNSRNILYIGPATQLHLGSNLLDQIQNRSRGIPVPTSPPVMPEKLKKRQNLKKETVVEFLVNHILQMALVMGGKVNDRTVQQILDIMILSSKLSQIQTSGLDFESQYNKMTIKQLEELTSGKIDWLHFLNRVYELSGSKYRFTYNDYCIVTDVQYFKKLPNILLNTSNTVLANFLGQILVNDLGVYTVESFRKLNFELLRMFYHVEEQEPLWKFCVSLVRNTMSFAISRKYIEQEFTERTKFMVAEQVNYITSAFYQLIEKNPILDEYSRRRSLAKLRAIKSNVGYPDWLFNNRILDNLYVLEQKCHQRLLFECMTYLLKRLEFKSMNSIDKPVDRDIASFPFDPTVINAAYYPIQNSITIPAAMINALFGCDNPRQLNYAQLGVIIGHELTHGFDTMGNKFDERGNLNEIFDVQTQHNLEEREKCFINEYNNFCDSGRCVNGQNTLGENTADNGGMRETYKAYKMCNQNNGEAMRLPYVSQYTADQIFFISYAMLWCERVRPEYLPVIYSDVHSPGKFRVNGVLANFQPFADSFKCVVNSTLNPKDKCILW